MINVSVGSGRTLFNQRVPMRDGIELAADVVLPTGPGPFPTVVMRTPYVRQRNLGPPYLGLVDRGYALAAVDMRGRGDSDGEFRTFAHDAEDGYDTVEWLASQSWSTGAVGMVGASYEGLTQWWTAKARAPSLRCIVPMAMGAHRTSEVWSRGWGIPWQYLVWVLHLVTGRTMQHPGAPSWDARFDHLPLATLDEALGVTSSAWQGYVDGELDYLSPEFALTADDWAGLDVPALVWVGWWDDQATMDTWMAAKQSPGGPACRLVIGAWDHAGNVAPRPVLGGLDVSASMVDPIAEVERFLARHLKDEVSALDGVARCRVFRTGSMRWDDLDDWPPTTVAHTWYLRSGGDARGMDGDGLLARSAPADAEPGMDTLVHDPTDPGRDMANMDVFAWSDPPLDQRYLQRRRDTLVYTSEPLTEPLTISGEAVVELVVDTDAADADVCVSLADVQPDGRAIAFNMGPEGRRLRHRNGPEPEPVVPHEPVTVRIPVCWLHHEFAVGHRIRLTVRGSSYPMMARNLGTGGHWAQESDPRPSALTVHHAPARPSRLIVPVWESAP